jgi:hypothetical protein
MNACARWRRYPAEGRRSASEDGTSGAVADDAPLSARCASVAADGGCAGGCAAPGAAGGGRGAVRRSGGGAPRGPRSLELPPPRTCGACMDAARRVDVCACRPRPGGAKRPPPGPRTGPRGRSPGTSAPPSRESAARRCCPLAPAARARAASESESESDECTYGSASAPRRPRRLRCCRREMSSMCLHHAWGVTRVLRNSPPPHAATPAASWAATRRACKVPHLRLAQEDRSSASTTRTPAASSRMKGTLRLRNALATARPTSSACGAAPAAGAAAAERSTA